MRDVEIIKVPRRFKEIIDEKRMKAGFNNRERQKFLRKLCKEKDPFERLLDEKPRKRGGFDIGF